MLTDHISLRDIRTIYKDRVFSPYRNIFDRNTWDHIDPGIRDRNIKRAERYVDIPFHSLPASLYMEFQTTGVRVNYETMYFGKRKALAALFTGELLENKGRFLDKIVDGIWSVCEESTWTLPATNAVLPDDEKSVLPNTDAPIVELFSSETAVLLGWIYSILDKRLDERTPLIRERMANEISKRVLNPYLATDAFHWFGFEPMWKANNWNPWINTNCLIASLIMEQEYGKKTEAIYKAMRSIDRFIDRVPFDGSCEEGPSYWDRTGASVYEFLEALNLSSGGALYFLSEEKVKNMGLYIVNVNLYGNWFASFADAEAKPRVNAALIYRFGEQIGSDEMMSFGRSEYEAYMESDDWSPTRFLPALVDSVKILRAAKQKRVYSKDRYMKNSQIVIMRENETGNGLCVAVKGGHNNEGHNHNDLGGFILYYQGNPVFIDPGVEEYTAKTFGEKRYEIWTMRSSYHNTAVLGGMEQSEGKESYAAAGKYECDCSITKYALNLTKAYPHKDLIEYKRVYTLDRKDSVFTICEDLTFLKSTEISLIYMTVEKPEVIDDGIIVGGVSLKFNQRPDGIHIEKLTVESKKMQRNWGDSIYRVLIKFDQILKDTIFAEFTGGF